MADRSIIWDLIARDRASAVFKKVGGSADGLKGKLKGFGSGIKDALSPAALGGAAAAGTALVAFGASSVQAFADSEQASLKLQEAFRKFPKLGDSTAKSFEKQAEALAKKTRFDDDATKSGQAVLAQFGLTGKQVQKLTPLLQDYAAKTGKDLPAAALDLGKAIKGQGRALKAVGLDLKDTGDETKNFEQLMGGLRKQVGGFAEKEGTTAQGKLAILQNRFGELQEKVGEKLLPILIKLADWMVNTGIPAIEAIAGWIGEFARTLQRAWADSETFRQRLVDVFQGVGRFAREMRDVVIGAVRWLLDKWLGYFEWMARAAATAFGWVPGIGGKLKDAAKEIEKFRDKVNEALGGIKDKEVKIKFSGGGGGDFGGHGASGSWEPASSTTNFNVTNVINNPSSPAVTTNQSLRDASFLMGFA